MHLLLIFMHDCCHRSRLGLVKDHLSAASLLSDEEGEDDSTGSAGGNHVLTDEALSVVRVVAVVARVATLQQMPDLSLC